MLALALLSALAAASPERPKLAVQDLSAGEGVEPELVRSLTSTIAAEVERRGAYDVVTSQAIATLLGQERQRQLLGCEEEALSCMAELAGALGAQFVLTGSLVRLGASWQLSLQTVDARTARAVGRAVRVGRDLGELVEGFSFTVAEAVGLPPPPQPSRLVPTALVGVGAAASIGGGVVLLQSVFRQRELETELRLADANPAVLRPLAAYEADTAALGTQRLLGSALLGAGLVAAAGGILWLASSGESRPELALLPAPAGLVLSGVLP